MVLCIANIQNIYVSKALIHYSISKELKKHCPTGKMRLNVRNSVYME